AAFDAGLKPKWTRFLDGETRELSVLGSGSIVLLSSKGDLSIFGADGSALTTTTLARIVGAPVEPYGTTAMQPDGSGGFVSLVRNTGTNVVEEIRFDPTLRIVGRRSYYGEFVARDGGAWHVTLEPEGIHLDRTAPGTATWSTDLALPSFGGRLIGESVEPIDDPLGGVFFVDALRESIPLPTRRELPRVHSSGHVTLFTPQGRRDRDVYDPTITDQAPELGAVGLAASDPTLLVAFRYGHDTSVDGAALPMWTHPLLSPIDRAAPRTAVVEIDAATMGTRVVHVLEANATDKISPNDSSVRDLSASSTWLALRSDSRVLVYPRGPLSAPLPFVPTSAAPSTRVVAPDPMPAPPSLVSAAPPVPFAASWDQVCGPHVLAKGSHAPCRLERAAIGPDGTVAVVGDYYGTNQIGTSVLPRRAFDTGVLAVYEPDGRLRFDKALGTQWHNYMMDVRVFDNGEIGIVGVHGNGFDAGGKRLPDRKLREVVEAGVKQDMGFEAVTPYLAIYTRDGKLVAADDLDAISYGDTSTALDRTCTGAFADAPIGSPFTMEITCEGKTEIFVLQGTTPLSRRPLAPLVFDIGSTFDVRIDSKGRRWGLGFAWPRVATAFETLVDGPNGGFAKAELIEPAWAPAFDDGRGFVRPSPRGGAVGGGNANEELLKPPNVIVGDIFARAFVARLDDAAKPAWTAVIGTGTTKNGESLRVVGVAEDETGRVLALVQTQHDGEIAGRPAAAGTYVVRVTADGTRVDAVLALAQRAGSCMVPGEAIHDFQVRAGRAIVLQEYGVTAACGVKDEPSAFSVFVLPP
ncbi:MAG TPA: hypothetical protein VF407_05250, partial [Polyangiaceae bacterium]